CLLSSSTLLIFFFFQAEDGIRDRNVTGVQTCALPIYFSMNSFSSQTATPSDCAFSSLLPASAPATTTSVLPETLPVTLPPAFSTISFASVRVSSSSLPVRTKVIPENSELSASDLSSIILTPNHSRLSIRAP